MSFHYKILICLETQISIQSRLFITNAAGGIIRVIYLNWTAMTELVKEDLLLNGKLHIALHYSGSLFYEGFVILLCFLFF